MVEARQRIAELEASEYRFKNLIEEAAMAMHWVNVDGIILWANQA